jgi:hypothetical protein
MLVLKKGGVIAKCGLPPGMKVIASRLVPMIGAVAATAALIPGIIERNSVTIAVIMRISQLNNPRPFGSVRLIGSFST